MPKSLYCPLFAVSYKNLCIFFIFVPDGPMIHRGFSIEALLGTFSLLLYYSVLRIRILGSVVSYLWLTDPDADSGGPKTCGSGSVCGSGTLVHWHHSSKIKSHNEVKNRRKQGFSSFFCLMMEGSGAGPGPGPGSVLVTNWSGLGSGYGSGSATPELYVFGALPCSLPSVYPTSVKRW